MPANELMLKIKGDTSGAKKALGELDGALDKVGKKSSGMSGAGLGALALGVTAFLKQSVDAALEMEAAQARLKAAVEATGASWSQYGSDMMATVDASALASGFDDKEMTAALANLTVMTGDADKAMQDLSLSQDLARSTGMGLEAASKLVAKVEEGRIGIAGRVLPFLKATMTQEEAMAALREHTAGQMEAFANTSAGQISRAKVALDQFQEAIGYAVLPQLAQLASVGANALHGFQSWPAPIKTAIVDVGALGVAVIGLVGALRMVGIQVSATGIIAAIGGLGVVAGEAAVGIGLLADGESALAVASLGAGAALGVLAVPAAIAATIAAAELGAQSLLMMIPAYAGAEAAYQSWRTKLFTGAETGLVSDYDALRDSTSALGSSWLAAAVQSGTFTSAAKLGGDAANGQSPFITGLADAQSNLADETGAATAAWKAQTLELSNEENNIRSLAGEVSDVHNKQKALNDYLKGGGKKSGAEYTAQVLALKDAQRLVGQTAGTMSAAEINAAVKSGVLTVAQGRLASAASAAAAKANGVTAAVNGIPKSKTSTVTVKVNGKPALDALNRSFAQIQSRLFGATLYPPGKAAGDIIGPQSGGVPVIVSENGYTETMLNWAPSNYARNLSMIATTLKGIGAPVAAAVGQTIINIINPGAGVSGSDVYAQIVEAGRRDGNAAVANALMGTVG